MKFVGKDLARIGVSLSELLKIVENQIVTCPDAELYAKEIAELKEEAADIRRLLASVKAGLVGKPEPSRLILPPGLH